MPLPAFAAILLLVPCQDAYSSDGRALPWPSGIEESNPYGRLEEANLNGNHVPDLVVHRGSHLVAYYDPHITKNSAVIISSANDFCVIRGGGDEGADALGVVDGDGLAIYKLDLGEGVFLPPIAIEVSGWGGAKKVRSAVFGSAGLFGFIGVGAAGKKVLVVEQTDEDTFVARTSPFTASATIRDLQPADWDGNPGTEVNLVVQYASTLDVLPLQGGSPVFSANGDHAGDAIAILRRATGGDCVAWVTKNASGIGQQLRFYGNDLTDPAVSLGATSVAALVAGDYDGDDDDDLLFSLRDDYVVHRLTNELDEAEYAFVAYDPTVPIEISPYGLEEAPTGTIVNSATPAWAPFTRSWHPDGLYPQLDVAVALGDFEIVRLVCLPEDLPITTDGGTTHPLFDETKYYVLQSPLNPGQLELKINKSPWWDNVPAPGQPNAATHLEVKVWRQIANGDVLPTYVENTPVWRGMFILPSQWATTTVSLVIDIIEPSGTNVFFSDCNYVQVRPVRWYGANVVQAWTGYINAFTMDEDTSPDDSLGELLGQPGAYGELSTWSFGTNLDSLGGRNAGSVPEVNIPLDPNEPIGQRPVDAERNATIE